MRLMKVKVLKDSGDDLFENLKSQYTILSAPRQGNCWQKIFSSSFDNVKYHRIRQ
jgi:hypothetical protein